MAKNLLREDRAARQAAVIERDRNIAIDAGAGTGKTTTLVRRIAELVAPASDRQPPLSMSRIAAITFTRRAAGELKLRLREQILKDLAAGGLSNVRQGRLIDALGALEGAYVGTIHSFADRLLRRHPTEARLSPSYEIVPDEADLVAEVRDTLVDSAQAGGLAAEIRVSAACLAGEAEQTIDAALRGGIPVQSYDVGFVTRHGLDALVRGMVRQRDVLLTIPDPVSPDLATFRKAAGELVSEAREVSRKTRGGRWLQAVAELLEGAMGEPDPAVLFAEVVSPLAGRPGLARLGVEFGNDKRAWALWNAFKDGRGRPDQVPLRDAILAPLRRWMAVRLLRLTPIVLEIYERVKAEHRVVDQLDLLLKLRNLLRDDLRVREQCQALFDHLLIDEFQDTDPLQAEIALYLCEQGARAQALEDVVPRPGSITIVGDPKQSIYRFRRADIRVYDEVRKRLVDHGGRGLRLCQNYRSRASLIGWYNDRLGALLGRSAEAEVPYEDLAPSEYDVPGPSVHLIPIRVGEGRSEKAEDYRRAEAEALGRYLRWLVERSEVRVRDPVTGEARRPGYGDVAILAIATTHLGLLFPRLDAMGVPHAARGGTLFLKDALHRRFLLGLRALSDPRDGVAQAALLRPPFFAVDLVDLGRQRIGAGGPEAQRAAEALAIVEDLRRRRLERSPGATARDLIDRTALGRTAAAGPNGAQRLAGLREICLEVDRLSLGHGLDFDDVTAEMRGWVMDPIDLDPPHPVAAAAVQIMTVHQAKGLEFPVVILWDGRALVRSHGGTEAIEVDREGRGWSLQIHGCQWDEPPTLAISETEQQYRDAERLRIVYVAATRARDLLVIPESGGVSDKTLAGRLIGEVPPPAVQRLSDYTEGEGAQWAEGIQPIDRKQHFPEAAGDAERQEKWQAARERAIEPSLVPTAVSRHAEDLIADPDDGDQPFRPRRPSRFGNVFGDTVHQSIGRVIAGAEGDVVAGVARATGLDPDLLSEARADVARAVATLQQLGLVGRDGVVVRTEYAVAGPSGKATLLLGYADLVAVDPRAKTLHLLDFKTDALPTGDIEQDVPGYCEQVRAYGALLAQHPALADLKLEMGLLFTADGGMRRVAG